MTKVALKDAKERLDTLVDDAIDEHRLVTVQRGDGRGAVLVSEEDYAGLLETAHLLARPTNASRLLAAVVEADAGALRDCDPLT